MIRCRGEQSLGTKPFSLFGYMTSEIQYHPIMTACAPDQHPLSGVTVPHRSDYGTPAITIPSVHVHSLKTLPHIDASEYKDDRSNTTGLSALYKGYAILLNLW